ncbi:hypothetical protein C8R41DRAFT_864146 [Lentinula lateritia]|uniref:Uncharacterized protein n=1 Tax=Lentinula lateritia TaxID=40482 RepID=A0ABQ8VSR6_9AGAR|nr:hypothetical protein C8R41DRAFT_864146 [Lentinula lateritia]
MVNSRIILTAFLTIGTVVLAVPIVPDGSAGAGTPEGAKLTYSERIIYLRRQSSLPEKYKGVLDAAAALVPVGSGSPTMRVDLDTARPSGTSPEKLAKIRQGFEQGEDLRKLMDIATAKP